VWLFDCRNTAASLLIHYAKTPLSLHFSSIPCGAWGCLIAYFQKKHHAIKNKKKGSKDKFQVYKKNKFKPYGFLKKSPPLSFRFNILLKFHDLTSEDI